MRWRSGGAFLVLVGLAIPAVLVEPAQASTAMEVKNGKLNVNDGHAEVDTLTIISWVCSLDTVEYITPYRLSDDSAPPAGKTRYVLMSVDAYSVDSAGNNGALIGSDQEMLSYTAATLVESSSATHLRILVSPLPAGYNLLFRLNVTYYEANTGAGPDWSALPVFMQESRAGTTTDERWSMVNLGCRPPVGEGLGTIDCFFTRQSDGLPAYSGPPTAFQMQPGVICDLLDIPYESLVELARYVYEAAQRLAGSGVPGVPPVPGLPPNAPWYPHSPVLSPGTTLPGPNPRHTTLNTAPALFQTLGHPPSCNPPEGQRGNLACTLLIVRGYAGFNTCSCLVDYEPGGAGWHDFVTMFENQGYDVRKIAFYGGECNADDDVALNWGDHTKHRAGNHEPSGTSGCSSGSSLKHNKETSIGHLAQHLAHYIHDEYTQNGQYVNIVTHSMGGVIVRWAMNQVMQHNTDFPPQLYIDQVVTLGTGHAGAWAACFSTSGQAAEQCWHSEFMTTLNVHQDPTGQGQWPTEWSCIGSNDDGVVTEQSATNMHACHPYVYDTPSLGHSDYYTDTDVNNNAVVDYANHHTGGWSTIDSTSSTFPHAVKLAYQAGAAWPDGQVPW